MENSSISDELNGVKASLEEEMRINRVIKGEMKKAKAAHEKCGDIQRLVISPFPSYFHHWVPSEESVNSLRMSTKVFPQSKR